MNIAPVKGPTANPQNCIRPKSLIYSEAKKNKKKKKEFPYNSHNSHNEMEGGNLTGIIRPVLIIILQILWP